MPGGLSFWRFSQRWRVLKPRPRARCGTLDGQWRAFEANSCTALGKKTLCEKQCPHGESCDWPKQFKNLRGIQLILATEQNAIINRALVLFLQRRTREKRVLVILDEARLLDANFELRVDPEDVRRFFEAVARARSRKKSLGSARAPWLRDLPRLLDAGESEFQQGDFSFGPSLHAHAYAIQKAGWSLYGERFRYAGYDLTQLTWSRKSEREIVDGRFAFDPPPIRWTPDLR